MGLEVGGGGTEEKEKEKEKKEEKKEKTPLCESIGHRPLRGRCPKRMFMDNVKDHLPWKAQENP